MLYLGFAAGNTPRSSLAALAVGLAAWGLAACAGPAATASTAAGRSVGLLARQLEVGGDDRRYLLRVPERRPGDDAMALVIVLHRRGGSAAQAARDYGMCALADANGFVVAYPETRALWGWSAGGLPLGDPAADLAFLDRLLDTLTRELPIDPDRVYCCGHSSGGIMAYDFAAYAPERVAAIGVVAGSIGVRGPGRRELPPGRPVSVVHVHGTGDARVPYDADHAAGARFDLFVSAPRSVAAWAQRNGCTRVERETVGAIRSVERHAGGRDGAEVVLHTLIDGPHAWPRSATFDAASTIWEFFVRHPRHVERPGQ